MGILLNDAPRVKYGRTEVTFPMPMKMYVDAIREDVTKKNIDRQLVQKVYGFRVVAEFEWGIQDSANVGEVVRFVNARERKYLKIGTRWYEMVITEFQKPNEILARDDMILKMRGKRLLSSYPDPNAWYLSFVYFDAPVGVI